MDRRSFVACLPVFLMAPTEAFAAPRPDGVANAIIAVGEMFERVIRPFERLGDIAERQYLVGQLRPLEETLYDLEQGKREAIRILGRQPLNLERLRLVAGQITTGLAELERRLRIVTPRLRLLIGNGSVEEAIGLLHRTHDAKMDLVEKMSSGNPQDTEKNKQDAELAVTALVRCQKAIQQARVALRASP